MKTSVIVMLTQGNLKPRRIYNKELVASHCGRFILRVGSKGKGALYAGRRLVLSSDEVLAEQAKKEGYLAVWVPSFELDELRRVLAMTKDPAVAQGIKWLLSKTEGGQRVSSTQQYDVGRPMEDEPAALNWQTLPGFLIGTEQVPNVPAAPPEPAQAMRQPRMMAYDDEIHTMFRPQDQPRTATGTTTAPRRRGRQGGQ